MHKYVFKIAEELDGERIDKALGSLIDTLSRSFIQKFIKDGKVTVNGEVVELKDNSFCVDEVNENYVIHVRFSKLPEMVEVKDIIEEWIVLPWPVFIAGLAVTATGIYLLKKLILF